MSAAAPAGPLLTVNCHEAWIHQLGALGTQVHIIDGMPGRYCQRWDTHVRPVPEGGTLRSLGEVLGAPEPYSCVIAHSLGDLMDLRQVPGPRLLVLHTTIEGRLQQEGLERLPQGYLHQMRAYLRHLGAHVLATSELKARSWGLCDGVVRFSADADAYPPWSGHVAAGIRVGNQLRRKGRVLRFDLHEQALSGLPVRLVGHNPDMQDVRPSASWEDLKALLSSHRFFVHTADPALEDGYNMATLEAMAAGLPVIGNCHPSSPIEHGVSGFLSDDPQELRRGAERLLADRELAGRMGQAARAVVRARFPLSAFAEGLRGAIEEARGRWRAAPARSVERRPAP